jgi:hypothetical protein
MARGRKTELTTSLNMISQTRRHWMRQCGMGFGGLALPDLLGNTSSAEDPRGE